MRVRPGVQLPVPGPGPDAAVAFVRDHLGDLTCDTPAASGAFRGGQRDADAALDALDITDYARRRNDVRPPERRGASRMSPWIRHGLLSLPALWAHVAAAPQRDTEVHPWPWLFRPRAGRPQSCTAWRKGMPSAPDGPRAAVTP
jgi:deoxyribodipyrimidine photolyase